MTLILVAPISDPPGQLDAPANFIHFGLTDTDPYATFLAWPAVSGAAKYNFRRESDNALYATGITGTPYSGSFQGVDIDGWLTHTFDHDEITAADLLPSTLYRGYMTATYTDGTGESGPSVVDGAMTANEPEGESGQIWLTNTPSYQPILPWVAGRGADTFGGFGMDDPAGGSAAATTIYCVTTESQLRAAAAASVRRVILLLRSGIYDMGVNSEFNIANGLVSIIDISPAPGALIVCGFAYVRAISNFFMCNVHILSSISDPGIASTQGYAFGAWPGASKGCVAYSGLGMAPDQVCTLFGSGINNIGSFANFIHEGLYLSAHPESGSGDGHSTGGIVGGGAAQISSIRDFMAHNNWRNWLSFSNNFAQLDGAVYNYGTQGTKIEGGTANVEHMLYVKGPNTSLTFGPIVNDGGSTIYKVGNRVIGSGMSAPSDSGSRITAAHPDGYTVNPFASDATSKRDRLSLILNTSGPRPAGRNEICSRLITEASRAADGETTGLGGIISDSDGDGVPDGGFPSGWAQNDYDILGDADPWPGVTSISATGVALGSSGRTILTSGPHVNYPAFHSRCVRRLAVLGVKP